MWSEGDVVVLRYRAFDGSFYAGRPLRVIEDGPDLTVALLAQGAEGSAPRLADGRALRDVPLEERWRWAFLRASLIRLIEKTGITQRTSGGRQRTENREKENDYENEGGRADSKFFYRREQRERRTEGRRRTDGGRTRRSGARCFLRVRR